MRRGVVLPGSTLGEEESIAAAAGRLSAEDIVTLAQVAAWWRYRLARNDAADLVTSLLGGVDAKGTATTINLTGGRLAITPPLIVPAGGGHSLLVHAYGQPAGVQQANAVYSLLGLAHFYNGPQGAIAEATTFVHLPGSATSLGLLAALTPGTNEMTLSIIGIMGATIEWTVDLYRLG